MTRDQIAEHYVARYTPDNLVVSAAGRLDHDEVVELTRPVLRRRARQCWHGRPQPARLPGPAGPEVGAGPGSR